MTQPYAKSPPPVPARAFTQGVGVVYQVFGVTIFLALMLICCSSGLLSSSTAIRQDLTEIGWDGYSVQRAMTVSLCAGIFCGLAWAGLGLGLQATHRRTPIAAVILNTLATIFFFFHAYFFTSTIHSWKLTVLCGIMGIISLGLLALAWVAVGDLRKSPPPKGFNILPKEYKVPYSHMHMDPPEVRLARELDQRKEQLAVQQKELELMEEKLKRKLDEKGES